MRDIRDQEMRTYDTKAAQSYLAGIHEARRKDLLDKLHSQLNPVCSHQLKILRTTCAKMFEENLRVSQEASSTNFVNMDFKKGKVESRHGSGACCGKMQGTSGGLLYELGKR